MTTWVEDANNSLVCEFIAKKAIKKTSDQNRKVACDITVSPLNLCKIQPIWSHMRKDTTYNTASLVKLARNQLDFQVSIE